MKKRITGLLLVSLLLACGNDRKGSQAGKDADGDNPFTQFVGKPYASYHYALSDTLAYYFNRKDTATLWRFIGIMRSLPDVLGDRQWQLESDYKDACWRLDFGRCSNAWFERRIDSLAEASREAGNRVFGLRMLNRQFVYYTEHDATKAALAAYRLERAAKTFTESEYPDVVNLYYNLAKYYYKGGSFAIAERLFRQTVEAPYNPKMWEIFYHARNYLGLIARDYHLNVDSADYWFRDMGSFRHEHGLTENFSRKYDKHFNLALEALETGNLGRDEIIRKNTDHGVAMLREAIDKMRIYGYEDTYIYGTSLDIANAKCHQGKYAEAGAWLDTARVYFRRMGSPANYDKAHYYKVMSKYTAATGHARESMVWLDSAMFSSAVHDARFSLEPLITTVRQIDQQDIQQKEAESRSHFQRFLIMFVFAAVLLVALAVIAYLYVQRRQAYRVLVQKNLELIESQGQELSTPLPSGGDGGGSLGGGSPIDSIRHYMEQSRCYTDANLTIDKLAQALGTNTHYLSDAIRSATIGDACQSKNTVSPNFRAFVNNYRIREAIRLLAADDRITLDQLIAAVGFNTRRTFYDVFKRHTGLSPTAFRESMKK